MANTARPRRGIVADGVIRNCQNASSTITCATVTGSGPPLISCASKPAGVTVNALESQVLDGWQIRLEERQGIAERKGR